MNDSNERCTGSFHDWIGLGLVLDGNTKKKHSTVCKYVCLSFLNREAY